MDPELPSWTFITSMGGSVFPDDYKGDFGIARRTAESMLSDARVAGNAALLADATIALGQVLVLQGEPLRARSVLEDVQTIVPGDANRQYRATTWIALAAPMSTNLFPGGMAAEGFERTRETMAEIMVTAPLNKRRVALEPELSDPGAALESVLVHDLAATIFVWRWIAGMGSLLGSGGTQLRQALDIPRQARQKAVALGADQSQVAYIDLMTADLLRLGGKLKEALEALRQVEAGYTAGSDASGRALCLMVAGDWAFAPVATVETWGMFLRERTPGAGVPDVDEYAYGEPDEASITAATSSWTEAEKLFTEAGARRGVAAVRMRRAVAAAVTDDPAKALEWIDAAIAGFEEAEDRYGKLLARAHRALILVALGRFPEDLATATDIATWATTVGSRSYGVGVGQLFSHVGWRWLLRGGHYERALACFRLARATFDGIGAALNVAQAQVDLGLAHRLAGDATSAVVFLGQAGEQYCDLLGGASDVAEPAWIGALNVGMLAFNVHLGLDNAEGVERSARSLRDVLGRVPAPAGVDASSWTPESMMPAVWTTTRQSVEEMLASARIRVPMMLGRNAWDAGDDEEAGRLFARALEEAADAAPEDRLYAQVSIAVTERRFDDAARHYDEMFQSQPAESGWLGDAMKMLNEMFGERGKQQAQLQKRRNAELAALAYANTRAWERAGKALDELEQIAGPEWWEGSERPWESLTLIGRIHEGRGDLPRALAAYRRGIDALEERRGNLVRDDLKSALAGDLVAQDLYFGAARAAMRAGDLHASFAFAEGGRARALLDLMAGTAAVSGEREAEPAEMREWRALGAQLSVLRQLIGRERSANEPRESRISRLESRAQEVEAQLRVVEERLAATGTSVFSEMRDQGRTLTSNEVVERFGPGTAMILYAYFFDDLLCWTLDREHGLRGRLLTVDSRMLDREIRELHRACASGDSVGDAARYIADALLSPVAESLEAHERLIFVPAGASWMLPFDVLPWNGEVLSARKTISYLPSASAIQFVSGTTGSPGRVLAVGNPAFMTHQAPGSEAAQRLDPLPWSEIEVAYIASLFDHSEALIGEQASEAEVRSRLRDYRYLHFATHGYMSTTAPLLSAIILAHGGAVTVYELMGMRIDADLVVLSACDTGRGVTTRGGEVLGMTRGLLASGAKSALVSLWPVNDASTSLLMGEFYRQLEAGTGSAEALRLAQGYVRGLDSDEARSELDRLEQALGTPAAPGERRTSLRDLGGMSGGTHAPYSHPQHWAPFILIG